MHFYWCGACRVCAYLVFIIAHDHINAQPRMLTITAKVIIVMVLCSLVLLYRPLFFFLLGRRPKYKKKKNGPYSSARRQIRYYVHRGYILPHNHTHIQTYTLYTCTHTVLCGGSATEQNVLQDFKISLISLRFQDLT